MKVNAEKTEVVIFNRDKTIIQHKVKIGSVEVQGMISKGMSKSDQLSQSVNPKDYQECKPMLPIL